MTYAYDPKNEIWIRKRGFCCRNELAFHEGGREEGELVDVLSEE